MKWTYLVALVKLGVAGQVYTTEQHDIVCERNLATCKVVCYNYNKQEEGTNMCDTDNLDYTCICQGGHIPSTSSNLNFKQTNSIDNTFPAAVAKCQTEGNECKLACGGGDSVCANKCELTHVCFPVEKYSLKENATATSSNPSTTISAIKSLAAPRPASNSTIEEDDIPASASTRCSVCISSFIALTSIVFGLLN
ncbi:hypothetical protein DSO57_1008049 [Entomophthora muscae]|uniref:Uncharacterized protein n=1 Tax=Entomophthora muscae TaxID=34485 RepID=A0ACC2RLZ7_9FUNG|nr:hypothetical protein DSO57_1008049 [Entomophthora muscae]